MTGGRNPANAADAAPGSIARPNAKTIEERRERFDWFFKQIRGADPALLSETPRSLLDALVWNIENAALEGLDFRFVFA